MKFQVLVVPKSTFGNYIKGNVYHGEMNNEQSQIVTINHGGINQVEPASLFEVFPKNSSVNTSKQPRKDGDLFLGVMDDLTKLALIPIVIVCVVVIWAMLFG